MSWRYCDNWAVAMRRAPDSRIENSITLAHAEIRRIKDMLARITDGRGLVIDQGTGVGDTTPPVEAGPHTLYGVKHTRAFRVTDGGGLDVDYEQGQIWMGGSFYSIGAGSLTLADDDVNYVFVNAAGAVADNVAGFPSNSAPLAQVTTVAGDITALVDRRAYLSALLQGGALPAYTVTNSNVDRTFDANATTLHELADVVATLIADVGTLHP